MLIQKGLVRFLLVVFTALALLSCGGAEERKAKYMKRAEGYFAEKKYDKAKLELKNVLQIDPKTADAYFLLGKIDHAEGDFNQSFSDYSMALELNPDYDKAREKLAHFYLMVNDNVKAEELAAYVLKRKPNDPEARTIHAVVLLKKGDTETARKIALDVIKGDPTQIEATMLLSNLYERAGDMDKAAEALIQGIAKNRTNVNLHQALAELYLKQKNFIKAEEVLQSIVRLEPDVLQHRINLSSFYAQERRPDKAEKVIRDAIALQPNDAKRYLLLAEYLISQNRSSEAESEIRAAIKTYPKEYKFQYYLASHYITRGRPGEAERIFRSVMVADRGGPDGTTAGRSLAELLYNENRRDEASKLLADVLKENPRDTQALMLRGTMELETQNKTGWQAAIADFRSLLKDQPDSPEILAMLARAHVLNNEPDLARGSLQAAVKGAPKNADASVRLALFLLNNDKDAGGALRVLDQFLITSPNDLAALQGKLQIFSATNNTSGILETLSLMKRTQADSPVGYMRAGEYLQTQKRYMDAVREFEQARDRARNSFEPVNAIARAYMQISKPREAIKTIDDFLAISPKNLPALNLKAEVFASTNESSGFFTVVGDIKRLYPDRADGYRLAGEHYLRQRNFGDARAQFLAANERAPRDKDIIQSLVQTYVAGDKPDEALTWLAEQAKTKPNDGLFSYLAAEVMLTQKKYVDAESQFKKSLLLAATNNQTYIRLADVSALQGRGDEAIRVLKQGLTIMPDDTALRLRLAAAEEASGHFDNAIAIYEELNKKDPDNYIIANNLASLLTDRKGDPASMKRALQLSSRFASTEEPALLDTLGWVYFKMDDLDRAIPLLSKAVSAAPKAAVLRYHLGMAYHKRGDKAAAKDNLTRAFALEQQFTGAAEGRAALKALE